VLGAIVVVLVVGLAVVVGVTVLVVVVGGTGGQLAPQGPLLTKVYAQVEGVGLEGFVTVLNVPFPHHE
jgi:hypothetical protein